jgi:hypothetical protein
MEKCSGQNQSCAMISTNLQKGTRNSVGLEDNQEQQGEWYMKKEVVEIVVATIMLWLLDNHT